MRQTVEVDVTKDERALLLRGGAPRGSDELHRLIASWPGWRRIPATGTFQGSACSIYRAPLWPSATLPLLESSLLIQWTEPAQRYALESREQLILANHELARKALWPLAKSICPSGKRDPFLHQASAVLAILHHRWRCMLADDMGLGKTATALWAWWMGGFQRLLILCPKSVKLNWRKETEDNLWPPEMLPCYIIDGTPAKRERIILDIQQDKSERIIVVCNYDLLPYLSEPQFEWLKAWLDSIVMDESHYLKSGKADRTKLVTEMCPETGGPEFRVALSGTPIRNMVDDLFTQIEIIRPGTWASYSDFCNRHLIMVPMNFGNMPKHRKVQITRGSKNLDALNKVMNTLQIRRMKEEVLDLPPKIRTFPMMELDGPFMEVYKAMKEFALVELRALFQPRKPDAACQECKGTGNLAESIDEEPVPCACTLPLAGDEALAFAPVARSAVEAAMRCEQLAQGFLTGIPPTYYERVAPLLKNHAEKVDGYPGAFVFPNSPKLQWLKDVMEELTGKPLLVFSRFNAPLIWLANQYTNSGLLIGATSAEQRHDLIESFQAGKISILFCQVKIAEGFSLSAARDVIFLGRDWSAAMNSQAEDRAHRIGQKGTVNIQIPIVINTVERLIDRKLKVKANDADQALVTLKDLMEAL